MTDVIVNFIVNLVSFALLKDFKSVVECAQDKSEGSPLPQEIELHWIVECVGSLSSVSLCLALGKFVNFVDFLHIFY